MLLERSRTQERIQVSAMIGMTMGDDDCIDRFGGNDLEESRQDGVARIDQ